MDGIGFYSETEFDLTSYAELKKQSLELGRSCIAPAYRDGRTIQLLWEGIAGYSSEHAFVGSYGNLWSKAITAFTWAKLDLDK